MAATLKFQYQSDIRRISVQKEELSLENAKKLASTLFPFLQNQSFHFKYVDDEDDLITVSTEKEFEEAAKLSNIGILRLIISLNPRPRPAPGRCGPPHPAYCDGCEERIRGIRHKCSLCPDYDLCNSCFEKEKAAPGSIHSADHLDHFTSIQFPWQHPRNFRPQGRCPFVFPKCRPFPGEEQIHMASCDGCEDHKKLIRGNRYKCSSCADYDLCQTCFEKEQQSPGSVHDKEHAKHFLQFSTPFSAPSFVNSPPAEQSSEVKEAPSTPLTPLTPLRIVTKPLTPLRTPVETRADVVPSNPLPEEPKVEASTDDNLSDFEQIPVESEPIKKKVEEASVEVKSPSPFEVKLKQLADMGFEDREKNIAVLVQHNGSLVEAVKQLVSE